MGLFDKKFCDNCGEKIGLLGNRKLEDGNICKNCADKLSPWFTERKKSTLSEIRSQLAYRVLNETKLASFRETRVLGSNWKVHIDDNARVFFVSKSKNWREENPDLISFDEVVGCTVDVRQTAHTHTEQNQSAPNGGPNGARPGGAPNGYRSGGPGGQNMTYTTYSYDFDVIISVSCAFFNEIKFRVNSLSVEERNRAQYDNMNNEANQIRDTLLALAQAKVDSINAANAPKTAVNCPYCGASSVPDANGCCQFCGAAIV